MTDKGKVHTVTFWCPHREVTYTLSPAPDGTYRRPDPCCGECGEGYGGGVVPMMAKERDGRCVHKFYFKEENYCVESLKEVPKCEWCGEPYGRE